MLTHSPAGGLPLGVLVTSSESQASIQADLRLLYSLFPERSFHGKDQGGPKVAITDDYSSLRQSIGKVYPDTTLILCVFDVLQAMRRWLWDCQNRIEKKYRTVFEHHQRFCICHH